MTLVSNSNLYKFTPTMISNLIEEFYSNQSRYQNALRFYNEELVKILSLGSCRHLISGRLKCVNSLIGKLTKNKRKYPIAMVGLGVNAIITDIVGMRVIVYSKSDEHKAISIIKKHFDTFRYKFSKVRLVEKKGGYRAYHIHVSALNGCINSTSAPVTCEIQITSISQHIFNELEHDIAYKGATHSTENCSERRTLNYLRQATQHTGALVERLIPLKPSCLDESDFSFEQLQFSF